jgi:hypothetical protein
MEHKNIIHMGFDRMRSRYAYHKFPDKCEWENGLQQYNKGGSLVQRWVEDQ